MLNVGGTATLNGALNLSLVNSFTGAVNNTFQIMNYGSHIGTFATVTTPTDYVFQSTYNAKQLVEKIMTVP